MNNNNIINLIVKSTGMTPQQAQQVVQQLPQQLAKAGIDINKLPPDGLLKVIQETYGRIKTGKTAPVPPKPVGLGGASMAGNPAQQSALANAAQINNK